MFSKKIHADVKKSTQKVQDLKKDSATRLKHLRIVLEHVDVEEAKTFFESNFSHIYCILYDSFVAAEANLKQRELSFHLVHKAHREELEFVLLILEKVLVLLPELISGRWQLHSLTRILSKLLHPGNSYKLRREAIRYFLLWYQALGDNAPDSLHAIFATLVPGFPSPFPGMGLPALSHNSASVFHDATAGPVCPVEIQPLLSPQSGEKQPEDPTRFFLDALLEFMVSQVTKVEWRDRVNRQHKCFTFLFERFKQYYLPHIFPEFSHMTSLYKPVLEVPLKKRACPAPVETADGKKRTDPFIACRVAVIRWVAIFTHITKKGSEHTFVPAPSSSVSPNEETDRSPGTELRRVSVSQAGSNHEAQSAVSPLSDSNHSSAFSQAEVGHTVTEDPNSAAINLVREVLYSTRENVNFVHEVYRQAFLLNFTHSPAIRKAIAVYKDWIQMNVPELPCFMLEPLESHVKNSGPPSNEFSSLESTESPESFRVTRLRNDSYLGAIHKENLLVRAGLQNLLQLFITHAANVFTLELSPDYPLLLEEQVDTCKRVLNIYRYMVMHTRMEARTWEQLLVVLLQITSLILSKTPPKHKEETLGGKLAPAIFQTLIVTWIKANLNVVISADLWDQFLAVLSSLTQWEELIREWAKTLETLTRVLARHVYGLDLTDLPLDRLTEQKAKKRRGNRQQSVCENTQNQGHPTHPASQPARNSVSYSSGQGSMRASSIPPLAASSTPCHDQSSSDGPASFNTTASELSSGTFQQHNHSHSHHHHHGMLGSSPSPDKRRSGYHGLHLRSVSEGNLSSAVAHRHRHKSSRMVDSGRHCASRAAPVVIPVLPLCVEREVARIIAHSGDTNYSQRTYPKTRIHKSRSMDSLRSARAGTPFQYSESEGPTRSPSPAPSSGVESNSIKDSPMQIDVISADGTSLDLQETSGRTSVMAGGTVRGWLPDVAVVLWRRMLGALGDVNQISSPVLHAQVFDYLVELSDTLIKIRMNQGVSVDGLCTPPPPDLIPPLKIIAPWCFKALSLPANYARGKLSALRLLCQMTMTHQDIPAPHDHVTHFYKVLHHGLIGTEQAVVNTIVQYCGPRFFSLMLPGYSLLMYDFIHAANTVLSSNDIATAPRTEAASILGTLLCLSSTFPELPVLQPTVKEFSVRSCVDAKDHIVPILLRCGKREPTGLARCIALSSLGIYVYQELSHGTCHPRIKDAVNVLLLALRFNNKTVALVASDVLVALSDHAAHLLEVFPEIPLRIIEVLALTLSQLAPRQQNKESLSGSSCVLLTSLMFCLGEWCMCVPIPQLVAHGRNCLLLTVFKVLSQLQSGKSHATESETPPIPESADYDLDIKLDNLREESAPPQIAQEPPPPGSAEQPIQLAAKMVLMHLVNHLGHFPMGIGAARLSSMVVEQDDVPGLSADELSAEVFSAPNIQLFVLSSRLLVSLVELPTLDVPGGGVTAGLRTALSQVRVILRDLAGKASWDASILYCSPDYERTADFSIVEEGTESSAQWGNSVHPEMLSSLVISSPPQHTLRHRPPHQLPTWEDGADDMDNLDDLLQYLGHTSPECLESLDTPRNIPASPPPQFTRELEEESMTSVLGQRNIERDFLQRPLISLGSEPCAAAVHYPTTAPFQHCRLLFSQLGLAGWERRSQLQLLAKNEKLLRELRNLDTQRCRETHKIAVIYVAEGQEDKNSILSNTCGSQAYEEFISGLAWEVELESHTGFLGGLQRNRSTGETAPYYATSFLEAIFHVATRMPSSSQESLLQKMRHLGNDEVHIVWSEHNRDYRRGIIPTEFCDVLIVIYPLLNGLYRVQVKRKPDVPYFGPLFNEAIVDSKVLPGLVRASAISASRAKRSMLPFYQNYYEERSRSLETVVCNHREPTTFEEFAAQVYSPVQTPSPFCGGPTRSSGTSLSSRSPEPSCSSAPSSTLAAALLDSHHHCSGSPSDSRIRGAESIRVWFAGNEVASAADSGLHGISPRPLKKLSFKTTARKSLAVRCESVSLTPPDSPTTRKTK
ncbi:probable Rho GTPase-activating protein CG5521 isoform X1 [Schistocerca gregaria]|uniref:probable Rho GTPase-activating protein CG5521 isoform X1 n=1 Tax=Schistocerca gregaria TaxID=7010 RepID=UPI00211EA4F2|nr:probable Rho GTPase-activating protein CG5521 isoform X1 [Schistocerca gregaria]